MTEKYWYSNDQKEVLGPVNATELLHLHHDNKITKATYVSSDDGEWKSLSDKLNKLLGTIAVPAHEVNDTSVTHDGTDFMFGYIHDSQFRGPTTKHHIALLTAEDIILRETKVYNYSGQEWEFIEDHEWKSLLDTVQGDTNREEATTDDKKENVDYSFLGFMATFVIALMAVMLDLYFPRSQFIQVPLAVTFGVSIGTLVLWHFYKTAITPVILITMLCYIADIIVNSNTYGSLEYSMQRLIEPLIFGGAVFIGTYGYKYKKSYKDICFFSVIFGIFSIPFFILETANSSIWNLAYTAISTIPIAACVFYISKRILAYQSVNVGAFGRPNEPE